MSASVRVWDPLVRIAHWTLVASVAVAWVTGDDWQAPHELAGYLAAGVVATRILWGFVGPVHARFTDFVRGPAAILAYLRDVLAGRERRHLGHNPAGGAMILALLATVLGLGLTGWMATTDRFWGAEWLEELHEILANGLLLLIALHVGGVMLASLREGDNLVRAMITGRKRIDAARP
ncbi:MAG: cytochrome b/b6 domain-containing protein [Thalassobaculum sp.]|uniref:cytochrome b/b6 domain-containing protein n=1 Tax=Thalassobaculum sp. TaxID=2022740 RepID=UPI0032F04796